MQAQDIASRIADTIKGGNQTVIDNVVNTLVQKEQEKRANTLITGLDLLDQLKRDLRKVKPDVVIFSLDGSKAIEQYSAAAFKAINESNQKIAKLEKALETALTTGDYSDLNNVAGAKQGDKSAGNEGQ